MLSAAGAIYVLAAWMVAPGFYDGFGPPQPYRFTCPPPQAGANDKPQSGHLDIPVTNGVSEPSSAFTDDGQVVISFLPGIFDATGKTKVAVDIKPLDSCPQPEGLKFVTNVYQITADTPLKRGKTAGLVLRYSNLQPDPSDVYMASDAAGPWSGLGHTAQAQPFTIDTSTPSFGYFAAGYPAASPPSASITLGGGQIVPIIVAGLIIVVVLAGLPLAIVRRRQGSKPAKKKD